MPRFIDLQGKSFGELTVISFVKTHKGHSYWVCSCSCGSPALVTSCNLVKGNSRTCGCSKKEATKRALTTHGMSKTKIYSVWRAMLTRCHDRKAAMFPRYGARGISVDTRWLKFENFLEDMGEAPNDLSIDRINNDGNYEPGNCRWATNKEQVLNRRRTVWLTYNDETLCLADMATKYGISPKVVGMRLKLKWSLEKALTTPVQSRK